LDEGANKSDSPREFELDIPRQQRRICWLPGGHIEKLKVEVMFSEKPSVLSEPGQTLRHDSRRVQADELVRGFRY
jgi:hypothetical protein